MQRGIPPFGLIIINTSYIIILTTTWTSYTRNAMLADALVFFLTVASAPTSLVDLTLLVYYHW
jgi:hypothetical protein